MIGSRKSGKTKSVLNHASVLVLAMMASSCASTSIGEDGVVVPEPASVIGAPGERVVVPAKADPMQADAIYADAAKGFSTYDWTVSSYLPTGNVQHVAWSKSHVALGDTHLSLMITAPQVRGQRFGSGEIQTLEALGYGSYEGVLRPAAGSGLLSSFYARSEGDGFGGPNEFGFAFQGKDPSIAHIRLVVDGNVLVQDRVDLGFDASEAFEIYTMTWTPTSLSWLIGGQEVYRIDRTLAALPDKPGKIFANIWTGTPSQVQWIGRPRFSSGASLDIACVAYRPIDETSRGCRAPIETPRAMADVMVAGG